MTAKKRTVSVKLQKLASHIGKVPFKTQSNDVSKYELLR